MTTPPRPDFPLVDRCLICGGPGQPYAEKQSEGITWDVRRCAACGFGFVANRPTPEYLGDYYRARGTEHADGADPTFSRSLSRLAKRVAELTPNRGRSLDVGCGNGSFSFHLHRAGFRPVLMDVAPEKGKFGRDLPGAEYVMGLFEDYHDGPFSVIVMSQVLEHALSPADWIRHAYDLLEPGGILWIALPNFAGAFRILGTRDPFICPPQHLNFFTRRSLDAALCAGGLTPVRFEHDSRISLHSGGALRRPIEATWNAIGAPVTAALLRRGIILSCFATKPVAAR